MAALLVMIGVTAKAPPASAAPGGRISLAVPTPRPGPAQPTTAWALGGGVVNVTVFGSVETAVIGLTVGCSAVFDPSGPDTVGVLLPGLALSRMVTDDAGLCLRSTAPVNVVVDAHGSIGGVAPDRLQFAPITTEVTLREDIYSAGTLELPLPTPPPDTEGTVLKIEGALTESQPGFATAYADCGDPEVPPYKSVYFGPDLGVALPPSGNLAYVPLPDDGSATQCIYLSQTTNVSVTLIGWLTTDGPDVESLPPMMVLGTDTVAAPGFSPVTPVRVLDTREGIGATIEPLVAPDVLELDLFDFTTANSTAVVLNVTVTESTQAGFLTVWPCDGVRPNASNLNYIVGQTVANLTTVALSSSATVCIFTNGSTEVIADLAGTYELGDGAPINAVAPARVLDTANGSVCRPTPSWKPAAHYGFRSPGPAKPCPLVLKR